MLIDEKLINQFIGYYRNDGYDEKTLKRFMYDFTRYYRWLEDFKKADTDAISKLSIEEYKQHLNALPCPIHSRYHWKRSWLSKNTIFQRVIVIKNFLKFYNDIYWWWMDIKDIRLPKTKSDRMDFRTAEEIEKIIQYIDKTEKFEINKLRLKLIIALAFTSWLRLSEIINLKAKEILDWKADITWKWDKKRYVFFTEHTQDLFRRYLEQRKQLIPRTYQTYFDSGEYAICSHSATNFGGKLYRGTVIKTFKKLSDEINLIYNFWKSLSCHTLRHSFATHLLYNWTNISYIQQLMGHNNIQTTSIYLHQDYRRIENEQKKVFMDFNFA